MNDIITVKVYDVTNDKYIDWNANEPKPLTRRTHHNRFILFMASFIVTVGALGLVSSTLEYATNTGMESTASQ